MNTTLLTLIRSTALAAVFFAVSATTHAVESTGKDVDRPCQIMDATGSLSIANVGGEVRLGSGKASVSKNIGRPDLVLPNGAWMFYKNFYVDHSIAHGSLMVSFRDDRVTALRLVSPSVAVAMVSHPGRNSGETVIASRR